MEKIKAQLMFKELKAGQAFSEADNSGAYIKILMFANVSYPFNSISLSDGFGYIFGNEEIVTVRNDIINLD